MKTYAIFSSSMTLASTAAGFREALRASERGGRALELAPTAPGETVAERAALPRRSCGPYLDRLPQELLHSCLRRLDAPAVNAFRQTCQGAFDLVNSGQSDVFVARAINAFVQGLYGETAIPAAVAAGLAASITCLHVSELWFVNLPGVSANQQAVDEFVSDALVCTKEADLVDLEGQAERLQWVLGKTSRLRDLWLDHRAVGYAFMSIESWFLAVPPTVQRLGISGQSLNSLGRFEGPVPYDLTRHLHPCDSRQLAEILLVDAFDDLHDQAALSPMPLFQAPVRSLVLRQDAALPLGIIDRICASNGSALRTLLLGPRDPGSTLVVEPSSVASLGHWALPNLHRAHLWIQEDEGAGGLLTLASHRWPFLRGLNLSLPDWQLEAHDPFTFDPGQWRSLWEGPAFELLEELTLRNVSAVHGLLAALCRKPGRALTKLHIVLEPYSKGFRTEDCFDGQLPLFGLGALKELQSITMPLFDVDWPSLFCLFSPLTKTLKFLNLSLLLRATNEEWPLATVEANMAHLFSQRIVLDDYRWSVEWVEAQTT